MLQSLFNKVKGVKPASLLKRDSGTGAFLLNLQNFQEHLFTDFTEHLWTASEYVIFYLTSTSIKFSLVGSSGVAET